MPFIASNLGGGTLAGKVAHQIDENRAAAERADADDAVAPYAAVQENENSRGNATASDAGSFDDDGPSWPSEAAESAFLAQQSTVPGVGLDTAAGAAGATDNEEQDASNLPPLDSLVARIPEETRKVLEELFRAQFKNVRKIPRKLLKK